MNESIENDIDSVNLSALTISEKGASNIEEPDKEVTLPSHSEPKPIIKNDDYAFKVFVGGLPITCSQIIVHNYFSKFGEIAECRLPINVLNGKSRGFAFITFKDENGLILCLDEGTHVISGKPVDVKKAVVINNRGHRMMNNRYMNNSSPVGYNNNEYDGYNDTSNDMRLNSYGSVNNGGYNGYNNMYYPPQQQMPYDDSSMETERGNANCKIFVGGLSHYIDSSLLGAHFNQFGPVMDAVVMVDKDTARSRGFGFITFFNEDSAMGAKSCKSHIIGGKEVEVKSAMPRKPSNVPYIPRGESYNSQRASPGAYPPNAYPSNQFNTGVYYPAPSYPSYGYPTHQYAGGVHNHPGYPPMTPPYGYPPSTHTQASGVENNNEAPKTTVDNESELNA